MSKKNNHKKEIKVQLYEIRFNINPDLKKRWEYFFCIVGIDDSPEFRIASAKALSYFRDQEFLIDDFLEIYIKYISEELFIPK